MKKSEKDNFLKKIAELEEEKADLELMLEAATGHSDWVEEELLNKVRSTVAASEKRFRLITETIPVSIMVTRESDGSIIFANKYAGYLFGIPVGELLKRKAQEFYGSSERLELLDIIKKEGFLKNRELQGKRADGSPFWVELTVQSFHFNDIPCLLSVWHDITRRRTLEKQLIQTQKMEAIGTLAAGISHDFNNILTAIFGYTELSMSMLPAESRIRSMLEKVLYAAGRAKAMVMQILAFCRQSENEMKPFQISLIVKEALNLLRQIIPSHIRINISIKTKQAIIIGDPTQIHQVLMNLCSNAADAMRQKGGCLDILLEEVDPDKLLDLLIPSLQPGFRYVRLSVMDNGPGMDKWIIDRIFDPFFTTKQPGKGTGMGLSVVHGIVKSHGGAISVESEPGKGTIFNIYFPLVAEVEILKEANASENIPKGSGYILLVDDEKDILDAYGEMLESFGYKADTRDISTEALEWFRINPDKYDLVITDYAMPDMTGIELAKEIILIRPDIPIILYTGYNEPIDHEVLKESGISEILMKPFALNELAALLSKFLELKKTS